VSDDASAFYDALADLGEVLTVKLYRLRLDPAPAVPVLPCLDHEALLHEGIAPHAAAYISDKRGHLHEVVYTPKEKRIDVDVVSTMDECTPEAHTEFMAALGKSFPGVDVTVTPVSWLKGDKRVANAVRAQVNIREVLSGVEFDRTRLAIDKLKVISALMDKQARVASWGSRTITTPFLALVILVVLLTSRIEGGSWWVTSLYYVLTLVGAFFLYSGLKAVHLSEMASRVWKRSAEYGLILDERQRLRDQSNTL
jgi:hypothetical protein